MKTSERWKQLSSLPVLFSKAYLIKQTELVTNNTKIMSHFRSPEWGRGEKMGFYSLLEEVMCGFQYFIYSIIIFMTSTRTVSKIIQSKWNEPFLFSYETKGKRKKLTFDESTVQSAEFHIFPHLTVIANTQGHYYLYRTEMKTETSEVKSFFQGHTSKRS